MKKILIIFSLYILGCKYINAQTHDFFLSPAVQVPLGDFSTSNWLGLGVDLNSINYTCDTGKQKKISFAYRTGIAYYFAGQRQKVNRYSYDYSSYYYGHVMAGALFRPAQRINIMVTAGPALSRYKATTRFNIAGSLDASYFIDCNLSVGPGIFVIKESGANPLYALALKLNFRL